MLRITIIFPEAPLEERTHELLDLVERPSKLIEFEEENSANDACPYSCLSVLMSHVCPRESAQSTRSPPDSSRFHASTVNMGGAGGGVSWPSGRAAWSMFCNNHVLA